MVKQPTKWIELVEKTLKNTLLYGEYELTIDEKNRLSVPSDIRKALDPETDGSAFFIIVGHNRKPWLYPEKWYIELVSQRPQVLTPSEDALAYDQSNFAMARRAEWDKQGRMLIPDKTLKRTGINKEITLIGSRNHLELWNRAEWDARADELERRRAEIALKDTQSQLTPQ